LYGIAGNDTIAVMERDEAENLIRQVVIYVRDMLSDGEIPRAKLSSIEFNQTIAEKFRGFCGLAQCVAGYAFRDASLSVSPVATQSLKRYWHGHAAVTVEVSKDSAPRWLVVDPTFIQFCTPVLPGQEPSPGSLLDQSYHGKQVLELLLQDGYLELTPERSQAYLAAFCRGEHPFATADEAFAFLKRPPPHEHHFCYRPGDARFSREALEARGLLFDVPKLHAGPC
jgi:hypothetical protein